MIFICGKIPVSSGRKHESKHSKEATNPRLVNKRMSSAWAKLRPDAQE
jgi:hypothetical protein